MSTLTLRSLRALLDTVGEGEWYWRLRGDAGETRIFELVHEGADAPVNVFAFGPPLSLHARAIASLHPGVLRELSDAQWAAQEARDHLLVALDLLQALQESVAALSAESSAALKLALQQLRHAAGLLEAGSRQLTLDLGEPPAPK